MNDGEDTTMEEKNESMIEEKAMDKVEVTIENYSFAPKTIKVKVGGTVTWTNKDSVAHTATEDNDEFDTGLIGKDQSKSITFDEAGTFAYHCTPHPDMKAMVMVE
jgi:plastocyanin